MKFRATHPLRKEIMTIEASSLTEAELIAIRRVREDGANQLSAKTVKARLNVREIK